jgi:hypothetical protein
MLGDIPRTSRTGTEGRKVKTSSNQTLKQYEQGSIDDRQ